MRTAVFIASLTLLPGCLGSYDGGGQPANGNGAPNGNGGNGNGNGNGNTGGGTTPPSGGNPGQPGGADGGTTTSGLTYYGDVLPAVQKSCFPCHATGGSGTPALDTYQSASTNAQAIVAAINNGTMPPFPPATGCNSYVDELRLSDADKATILGWAQNGTPEGDAAAAPPYTPSSPTLGTPDRALGGVSFTPTYPGGAGPNDLYWCFPLDPGVTVATDLIAAEVIPGTPNEVHHVIISRDPGGSGTSGKPATGFECNGVPGQMMYAWVPGSRPFQLPSGVGMTLQPGDKLYMQVHYHKNPSVTPSPDMTKTNLYYAKATQAQHAWTVWTGTPTFTIPANTIGYKVNATCTVNGDWQVIGVAPHMHTLGTAFQSTATAASANTCLMTIPRWDFNWQGGYFLQAPLTLHAGDKIATSCTYNNNTSSAVKFGESTGDEMCFGFMTVIAAAQPTFSSLINTIAGLPDMCAQ